MTAAPEGWSVPRGWWWLLVVAMAAAWPIANLLHWNWSQLVPSDVVHGAWWWTGIFGLTSLLVLIASRSFRRVTFAQFALAAAVALILLFLYEVAVFRVRHALSMLGLPGRAAGIVCIVMAALAVLAVLWVSRRAVGRRILATFIVVGSGASFALFTSDLVRSALHDPLPNISWPLVAAAKQAQRHNVFLVILDGYSRHDVLSRMTGFDNGPVIGALRARGFTVLDKAVANYPVTYLSLSSLLAADYLAAPELPAFTSRRRFYDIIQGNNPLVASFRALGYAYVHSGNLWRGSACGGREDFCLNDLELAPAREIDLSIIRMTPFRFLLAGLTVSRERGDLESILGALDAVYRRTPFFLLAHTLPPHPPFGRDAECGRRTLQPSLEAWSDPQEYRDSTLCVNRQVLKLVDTVAERDPNAMLVFLSDHGSSFAKQLDASPDEWTDEMIAERFPTFMAIKAPPRCQPWLVNNLSNINVGRFLVACVSGIPPDYRPDRFFAAGYERNPNFGSVYEITDRVQSLGLR